MLKRKYSTKHAALDRLMAVKNYGIEKAIVLRTSNIEQRGAVDYVPIYCVAFL